MSRLDSSLSIPHMQSFTAHSAKMPSPVSGSFSYKPSFQTLDLGYIVAFSIFLSVSKPAPFAQYLIFFTKSSNIAVIHYSLMC